MELACPVDGVAMDRVQSDAGLIWVCGTCAGRAATVGILRKIRSKEAVAELWMTAKRAPVKGDRPCPSCRRGMNVVGIDGDDGQHLELDLCLSCHVVFFDVGELDRTPATPAPAAPEEMPYEARRALALAKAESIKTSTEDRMGNDVAHPAMWAVAMFGLPVELGTTRLSRVPVLTWGLALLTLVLSIWLFTVGDLETAIDEWGLIPAEWSRKAGLTLITGFFLHAGWVHLLGNLYFWITFGDNLEDVLGWGRYLLLLAAAALVGDFAYILSDSASMIPAVGASGGISGLLVAYAIRFPRAHLGLMSGSTFFRAIRIPIWGFLAIWLLYQFVGLALASYSGTSVAYWAHLGGAAVGLGLGMWWRSAD